MARFTIDVPEHIAAQIDPLTARFIANDSGDGKVFGLSLPAEVLGTGEYWFQMMPLQGEAEADSIRDYHAPRIG